MKASGLLGVGVLAVVLGVGAPALGVSMDTVPVGNPGNPNDTQYSGDYGGVDYVYNIGTFEVTAGQYAEFLNAVAATDPYGLYNSSMASWSGCQITQNGSSGSYTYDFSGRPSGTEADWADRPVNYVSWGDAARFSNWMHNGQGSGDTEDGSYFLDGAMTYGELMAVTRAPNATWAIPSENEWYKAAYHKNDGVTGNYFDYPTGSDSMPSNDLVEPIDPGNNATFRDGAEWTIGSPYYRTEVGAHENSESPYGTFDQGGNMYEWDEADIGSWRGVRGGSFAAQVDNQHAASRVAFNPTDELWYTGFRVVKLSYATLTVTKKNPTYGSVVLDPEPSDANAPQYLLGTEVTLTAEPNEGKSFKKWKIWDPNDPNYFVIDTNNPIAIALDGDYEVKAIFKCGGGGLEPLLPMVATIGLLSLLYLRRRQ